MCSVKYFPDGNTRLLLSLASGLYDTYEYPRLEFSKETYLEMVLLASRDDGMYVCMSGDGPLGAITVSDLMYDVHFGGVGRHVTNFVVLPHQDSLSVVRKLLREFRVSLVREGECTWYSTTHRRDFYTLTTRYWRL